MKTLFLAILLLGSQSFAGQFGPPVTNSVQYQMYGTTMEMPKGTFTIYNLKMKSRTVTNGKVEEKFWNIANYSDQTFLCNLYGYEYGSVQSYEVEESYSPVVKLETSGGVTFGKGASIHKIACFNGMSK